MKIFARICSTVFHPLLVPTAGILISLTASYLSMLGNQFISNIVMWVAILTILLPSVGVLLLYKAKRISSIGLVNREERTLPYLLFLLCYICCGVFLWAAGLRGIQCGFVAGGVVAIIVDLLINRKWKISVHMTSIGGLAGLIFMMSFVQYIMDSEAMYLLQIAVILAAGCLGTSRILLKRHTLGQVVCGFINGFVWVSLGCYLFLIMTMI